MNVNILRKTILFLAFFNVLSFLPVAAQPVTKTRARVAQRVSFLDALEKRLDEFDLTIEKFCPQNNIFTKRILSDYGAAFVGKGKIPLSCYLKDEYTVQQTQRQMGVSPETIGGVEIELQPAAMEALLKAVAEAKRQGLSITPRGGSIAARRSYSDTVSLWSSRVNPGLTYWVRKRRLSAERAKEIRAMDTFEQVAAILELEEDGIYFSTTFSKSILYSVAAPGASQHNMMLALDVAQYDNPKVRRILADNGWFQTVISDLPHFTYLGVTEGELPKLGLRRELSGSQVFWIPQM